MAMRPRAKVARAIEPNQGIIKAAAKQIKSVVNAFENEYKREALKIAAKYRPRPLASDASSSRLPFKRIPKEWRRALIMEQARLKIRAGEVARKVSKWYCRKLLRDVTKTQRRTLQRAGVATSWLDKKWTVPVIRGQYISPAAAAKIPDFVDWSTGLISKLCDSSAKKVQDVIAEGITKGHSMAELTEKINKIDNIDADRAARIARDQSCKLNQFVQQENAKALGITEGIWVHVPGQFSSRESHMSMDKCRFNLNEGMYDDEVDAYVMPGDLINCRCVFRPVIPKDILG